MYSTHNEGKSVVNMSQYFPKAYDRFGGNVNFELDLPNYAGKTDLKGTTGVNTFNLAGKSDLTSLKAEADKLDIDKNVHVDLSKLSNVVNNEVVKKTVYDRLVSKVEKKYRMLVGMLKNR